MAEVRAECVDIDQRINAYISSVTQRARTNYNSQGFRPTLWSQQVCSKPTLRDALD